MDEGITIDRKTLVRADAQHRFESQQELVAHVVDMVLQEADDRTIDKARKLIVKSTGAMLARSRRLKSPAAMALALYLADHNATVLGMIYAWKREGW